MNRFIHVLGLEAIDTAGPVRDWASKLSLHFQREAEYLEFRPSQVAAACLMFAINIVDQGAEVAGQKPVTPEIAASLEIRGLKSPYLQITEFAGLWTQEVRELTDLTFRADIVPALEAVQKLVQES